MTDAPETDASFLAPVPGAGFWSVCHGHKELTTRLGELCSQEVVFLLKLLAMFFVKSQFLVVCQRARAHVVFVVMNVVPNVLHLYSKRRLEE